MSEQEFLDQCEGVLDSIENGLDALPIDVDSERSGQVLQIEMDNGTKIIVNGNTPMREIWVAAKSGGFHFKHVEGKWLDTRNGTELYASLSACLSQQGGQAVVLSAKG